MAGAGRGGGATLPSAVAAATQHQAARKEQVPPDSAAKLPVAVHAWRLTSTSTQHLTDAKLMTFNSNMANFSCQLSN